jgi:hypothetical protein
MTMESNRAAESLADIARIERRTREAIVYGASSAILILWGVLTALGNLLTQFNPREAGPQWLAINVAGFIATNLIIWLRRAKGEYRASDFRFPAALLALAGFGLVWSYLLAPMSGAQISAFWTTLAMVGYVLAGIWLGRFFITCGIAVTALTLVGYFWLGHWFPLWMAAIEGGALIGGGLWLRRIGVR